MNREQALVLVEEYTKNVNLRRHMLAVEAAIRTYARKFGEDEDLWGVTGLLHDFDYETYPDEHPARGVRILEEQGCSEEIVYAIKSHADYLGIERIHPLDKTLFAVDDLTGFIVAVALVMPNKSLHEVTVASVKKKLRSKGFARNVDREELHTGAEALGVPLDDHIETVLRAMQGIADELGLA
ncbi:MAG: HD domain-containing protein [Candidatus Bipolaricaulia bacterium]